MQRHEDWPERLTAYIGSAWKNPQPHQFGVMDCCLYAAGAVEALSGVDIAADWRGTYDDLESAQVLVSEIGDGRGIEGMLEALAAEHGWCEVEVNFIQRGDVLFIPAENIPLIGDFDGMPAIWSGSQPTFFTGQGWGTMARGAITRAWHFD